MSRFHQFHHSLKHSEGLKDKIKDYCEAQLVEVCLSKTNTEADDKEIPTFLLFTRISCPNCQNLHGNRR